MPPSGTDTGICLAQEQRRSNAASIRDSRLFLFAITASLLTVYQPSLFGDG